MEPYHLPVTFFLALFTCQAARTVDPSTDLSCQLGSSVDLAMGLPKGADFTAIILHSVNRRKGVALWQAGHPVQVLNTHYSKRVTLTEDTRAFRIHHLGLEDTGTYNVYMQSPGSPTDVVLKAYTVFVFNVTATPAQLSNGSCSLDYLCEVGWPGVKYSWKNATSGDTVAQGDFLHLVLHPKGSKDQYTCMAQASSSRGSWDVTPYEHCHSMSGAAGYLKPALPRGSCLLSAALVVLVVVLS
ncbi:hypothetical protein JRQ81_009155 [Phrynocephalus forsythii]|uniref:Uncharacterized protein n=1 Tax=Phrynocephalus forsythii TaxID=171643 RepID=A0A9Q0X9E1_9SAUR|nr:hypothetical protein JRQ81_009155 [Phrynocephalus forsythii]